MNQRIKPTESELEILQILWQEGTTSVKCVHEKVALKRDIGYTTTLKIMQIMTEKGFYTRVLEGKSHYYTALVKEEDIQNGFIDTIVNQVFQGSAMDLVIQTLGNYKASNTEISELKQFIELMEKNQK